MMSQEYKAVIEEYSKNASKTSTEKSDKALKIKKDFEVQRKRTI